MKQIVTEGKGEGRLLESSESEEKQGISWTESDEKKDGQRARRRIRRGMRT